MKQKTEEKQGFIKEVCKNVRLIWKMDPFYLPFSALRMIISVVMPFITIFLSAEIMDQMVDKKPFDEIMVTVLWMLGTVFVLEVARDLLRYVVTVRRSVIFDYKNTELADKSVRMDYDILERNSTMDKLAKAEGGGDAMGGFPQYIETLLSMVGGCVSLATAIVSIFGLFSSELVTGQGGLVYFMTSPYSTILLLICIGISVLVNSRCEVKSGKLNYEANIQNTEQQRVYQFFFNLIFNQSIGKDIRLFRIQPLIATEQKNSQEKIEKVKKDTLRKTLRIDGFSMIVYQIFILLAYFFVGIKTVLGVISLGEMTKYIGIILLVQSRVSTIFSTLNTLKNHNIYIRDYCGYVDIPNEKYEGTLPVEKRNDSDYQLEFRNVSFHYPNSEQLILKNITFQLQVGQKLAIVGPNGAGKTTFIKLLSRLYDPSEGEILLNGINIKKYSYEEYQSLFSVVFQDFSIFSFPLAENVAGSTKYDEDRIWESLRKAGIDERVKKLPKGLQTKLMKDQQEDGEEGMEISGGEQQKIALARALYHDAPIVILDEPTSALDPIAEQDIYERFNSMVEEKTAVFISHRMSSCRFCDKVIVFNEGQIIQDGTHEELVKQDGLYAEMWNAQAQYYTKAVSTGS